MDLYSLFAYSLHLFKDPVSCVSYKNEQPEGYQISLVQGFSGNDPFGRFTIHDPCKFILL